MEVNLHHFLRHESASCVTFLAFGGECLLVLPLALYVGETVRTKHVFPIFFSCPLPHLFFSSPPPIFFYSTCSSSLFSFSSVSHFLFSANSPFSFALFPPSFLCSSSQVFFSFLFLTSTPFSSLSYSPFSFSVLSYFLQFHFPIFFSVVPHFLSPSFPFSFVSYPFSFQYIPQFLPSSPPFYSHLFHIILLFFTYSSHFLLHPLPHFVPIYHILN